MEFARVGIDPETRIRIAELPFIPYQRVKMGKKGKRFGLRETDPRELPIEKKREIYYHKREMISRKSPRKVQEGDD